MIVTTKSLQQTLPQISSLGDHGRRISTPSTSGNEQRMNCTLAPREHMGAMALMLVLLVAPLTGAAPVSHFAIVSGYPTGRICRGRVSPASPGAGFTQISSGAATGEWHWDTANIGWDACTDLCRQLGRWNFGCAFISYGSGWCYVHQECTHQDAASSYTIYQKHSGEIEIVCS